MAIIRYIYSPILVDISDTVIGATVVKRRARRYNVQLPDSPTSPCLLEVEVIPYAQLPDGGYGEELVGGVFTRNTRPVRVSSSRLVDTLTGAILASRHARNGALRPDADWLADVARIEADSTVEAMYQNEWFGKLMRTTPAIVDNFIVQYILLANLSGDLD